MTLKSPNGVENPAFEPGPETGGSKVFRPYDEDKMDTIDLRKIPEDRDDRFQAAARGEDDATLQVCTKIPQDEGDPRCGWFFFRPDFLQRFRTPKWVLFWLCWASAMQGMVVNGFVNVVITTIEKRFSLRSSETGLVAGGYDIASFLCLVPVTYYGGRPDASKPRWIGYGVMVIALGSFVFAMPHFMVSAYRGMDQNLNICRPNSTDLEYCQEESNAEHLSSKLWLFVLSQLLTGAGSAPLYTLGVTYLDENVTKKMSSVYLGVYYTLSLIGPAIGYLLGGEFLKIYTDFMTNDPNEFGLTLMSNVWVGAWWIGFILSGMICLLIAIPIISFPPTLPGALAIQIEKISEAHGNSQFEAFRKLREIPRAFRDLLVNPTFSFLNLAGASEGFLISGFAAFLPKLIENEFSLSASLAAILMGVITVPAGGGGTFLGGYLVKRLDLKCAGIIKLCITSTVLSLIFVSCFFLTCPNQKFAGLNVPYTDSETLSLISECNADCGCSPYEYDPVCGIDEITYYSPCHAGCQKEFMHEEHKAYMECKCVKKPLNLSEVSDMFKWSSVSSSYGNESFMFFEAKNLTCQTTCRYLWLFVVLAFFIMLFTFIATMPALSATLRCVRDEQRSFALGIQWIVVRILGTIPSPMIFGLIIDKTCILWGSDCDDQGSCLAYDNYYMSRYTFGIAVIGKTCSLLFFFCSWWFYVPPSDTKSITAEYKKEKTNAKKADASNGMNGGTINIQFENL